MERAETSDRYLGAGEDEIRSLEEAYLFPTYKRYDVVITRGEGAFLYDLQGRRYLDFLAGIAVNCLGYGNSRISRVLKEQGERLIHCSNLLLHPYQGRLAERLVAASGMAKAFFTNSGTEAVEAALKISRAWAHAAGYEDKHRFLAVANSFHGRTLGALSVTFQEKYQAPFRPLLADTAVIQELSPGELEKAFDRRVCGLILEPIQGEGGIRPLPDDFLTAARDLCNRHQALLIFDEIQSGFGRTGKFFAFQHTDVKPDLITIAKGIAAGYPLGAVLGNAKVAASLKQGDHGTTFGGGPLACRIALEVLDIIEEEGLVSHAAAMGSLLLSGLEKLKSKYKAIREVRGKGLMIGVELGPVTPDIVRRLLAKGIIANASHQTVLRLVPPLIITGEHVEIFLESLDSVLGELEP